MIDLMLRNDSEKQIGLCQNPLTKEITVSEYDKQLHTLKVYYKKKDIVKIFIDCLNRRK